MWTDDELSRIGEADELSIALLRQDGSLRKPVIIWVVRVGNELYARSAYGRGAAWFRGVQLKHKGRIDAGGIQKDVSFEDADPTANDAIDTAYRSKYRRHGAQYVDSVTNTEARSTTIRIVPND
ncbi:MAG TPA: DUF2255 family protein [Rhodopila sp.]|jgi:hypothetical protein